MIHIIANESTSKLELNEDLLKYRLIATFPWRDLQQWLFGVKSIQFKNEIFEKLIADEVFVRDWRTLNMIESRKQSNRWWKQFMKYDFIKFDWFKTDPERLVDLSEVLEAYDQSLATKFYINAVFYITVLSMGTDRHQKILQKCLNNEITGSFCLTELSHGSDISSIRTECHYQQGILIMHTPDDDAIKCWAGNLAMNATHAIVFAQLYVNEMCFGLHAFCMQIRDLNTMKALPGITIGDMGEKVGEWNGVDNGWIRFHKHRFDVNALLNRRANLHADGTYHSSIKVNKEDNEQYMATLVILSIGRVAVIGKGVMASQLATVIATRYSAVRKQFHVGNSKDEQSVIEYPLQQQRLFPFIAITIVQTIFYRRFSTFCYKYFADSVEKESVPNKHIISQEIHILSCAVKVVSTQNGVEALDNARLACGAYGFLKSSRLNDLRDSFDPSRTFEGDNNILLQQVTCGLISAYEKQSQSCDNSMFGSLKFLNAIPEKFDTWKNDPLEDISHAYIWLLHTLINMIKADIEVKLQDGFNRRQAQFASQNEQYKMLTYAYAELAILNVFQESLQEAPTTLRGILHRLAIIYAYNSIRKHIGTLYINGYTKDRNWGKTLEKRLQDAQSELLFDAVSVCDAFSIPDFILHSILGCNDGNVYQRLLQYFMRFSNNT